MSYHKLESCVQIKNGIVLKEETALVNPGVPTVVDQMSELVWSS